MWGVTRTSLSAMTIRSWRAAASMQSRLNTLAFGYGGPPGVNNWDGGAGGFGGRGCAPGGPRGGGVLLLGVDWGENRRGVAVAGLEEGPGPGDPAPPRGAAPPPKNPR